MWKSFWHRTRSLSLFSPHLSPSSTTPSSSLVPSSHCLSSIKYLSHATLSSQQEEDSRNVEVIVWWEFDSCRFPLGANPLDFVSAVTAVLRVNGINGSIRIKSFGNLRSLERFDENNIPYSEAPYGDVPVEQYKRERARKTMFWSVLEWAERNPPPAHLFFICAGKYFADLLQELRMRKYNILLASDYATVGLRSAATIMWRWNSIACMVMYGAMFGRENIMGKHLNKPPDSPSGSWYGYLDVPFKNPSSTSTPDSKVPPPPAPISVLKHIHEIMKSHPEGICRDHLVSELVKVDWKFDKKYYDPNIFTGFIASFGYTSKVEVRISNEFIRAYPHNLNISWWEDESLSPPELGDEIESSNTIADCDAKLKFDADLDLAHR